jgi:hypothetical protein
MDCRVYHQRDSSPAIPPVSILEASVPTSKLDPFGQVDDTQRGYLKLRGSVFKRGQGEAHYRFTKTDEGTRYVSLGKLAAQSTGTPTSTGDALFDATLNHNDVATAFDDSIGSIYPDNWEAIDRNAEHRGPLCALRVTQHYAILLVPTQVDILGDVFERIGLLELRETESPGYFHENSTIDTVIIV